MARATWYLLEDGTPVDPNEVAPNDTGRLAHKSGLVAMREDGETPRTRGVDVDASGNPLFGGKGDHDDNGTAGGSRKADDAPPKKTEDMKPAPKPAAAKKPGYKTRGK